MLQAGRELASRPSGRPRLRSLFLELLRRKSLALGNTLSFGRGIGRADGLAFVTKTWRTAAPVTGWLDQQVGATTLEVQPRGGRRRSRLVTARAGDAI